MPTFSPSFSPYVQHAIQAALAAGKIQRDLFGRPTRIEYKGPHDEVTEGDRASEEAIVGILSNAFPTHAFLGEEGGQRGTGAYTWLIDPLDGTHNFARAIPWFAVSIALRHDDRIIAGVILNTMFGEVYAAQRGGLAWAAMIPAAPVDAAEETPPSAWRRITVSPAERIENATLATGFPRDVAETRGNLDHFANVRVAADAVRAIGSAALSLAAVGAGQIEGYWEIGPKAWDFAAGALLVEEAGGRVTDLRGRPLRTLGGQLLATNGRVHDAVVAVLAKGTSGLAGDVG